MIKVGINGFGRIGRLVLRAILERNENNIEVKAINDLGNINQNIHLLNYDSVHGKLPYNCEVKNVSALINNFEIKFYNEKNTSNIPWSKHEIDLVLECTGIFTKSEDAIKHINGSVKKVLISAPATNADITVVFGVNNNLLKNGNSLQNIPLASKPYSFQSSNVPRENSWKDFVQITL